jgi:hypothetical protein
MTDTGAQGTLHAGPPVTQGPEAGSGPASLIANQGIADKLRQAADLLAQQGANPFRVTAYRRAADAVAHEKRDLREILDGAGMEGLLALPHVGRGIAAAIAEMLRSGRWSQLERLRGTLDPVRVFQTVPGVGPALARRVHDALGIDTLEALEVAAHDGMLATVPGIGARRIAVIQAGLASKLGRAPIVVRNQKRVREPDVDVLLDVDREYRAGAAQGRLPVVAPRRFNPEGKPWLPILHTSRDGWHFTVLYSNTARAHELKRTRDWVVVYFHDDEHREGQRTVVTETHGPLQGKRIVRGREALCARHYEHRGESATT